jgi:hypothetical protein
VLRDAVTSSVLLSVQNEPCRARSHPNNVSGILQFPCTRECEQSSRLSTDMGSYTSTGVKKYGKLASLDIHMFACAGLRSRFYRYNFGIPNLRGWILHGLRRVSQTLEECGEVNHMISLLLEKLCSNSLNPNWGPFEALQYKPLVSKQASGIYYLGNLRVFTGS